MKGITKLSIITLSALSLSACNWFDGNDDNDMETTANSYIRIHHTSSDAPNVNVSAGEQTLVEDAAYQQSTALLETAPGTYSISVDAILPDQSTSTVIGPADLTFEANKRYEIFAAGQVADASLEPLIISSDVTDVTAGNARLQVVHAAYNQPMVDVYLTQPDTALADAAPVATLSFSEYLAPTEVTAGDYRIRVTLAGEQTAIYDSGTLSLADGGDYVVAATNNTAAGDSPLTLLVADGDASVTVPDANSGSDIRVAHASADAPNVDVTLDNAASAAVTNLAFKNATAYVNIAAGDHLVDVAAAGGATVLNDVAVTTELAGQYSVYAVGAVGDSSLTLQVLPETTRAIATAAQLQIVHASPSAGEVDIYLTETADISDATPAFAGVAFDPAALVSTGTFQVTPGDYYVTVTAAGTDTAAIGPVGPITLEAGGIYTAVAVDADGGGLPPQLMLLDDFQ